MEHLTGILSIITDLFLALSKENAALEVSDYHINRSIFQFQTLRVFWKEYTSALCLQSVQKKKKKKKKKKKEKEKEKTKQKSPKKKKKKKKPEKKQKCETLSVLLTTFIRRLPKCFFNWLNYPVGCPKVDLCCFYLQASLA